MKLTASEQLLSMHSAHGMHLIITVSFTVHMAYLIITVSFASV